MRPFFPFYGSKWNLARRYPRPLGVVAEPFAGSAAYSVYFDVERADLVDADPVLAGVWDYLIRVMPTEVLALPDLPEVGESVDDHPLPQEAKWLIGFWLNRGSATPKKTRTAYSARTDRAQLNWGAKAKARIADQVERIRRWTVRCDSYESAQRRKTELNAAAEERRRIARLVQDAASRAVLLTTQQALLRLREDILALEDKP